MCPAQGELLFSFLYKKFVAAIDVWQEKSQASEGGTQQGDD
jgi:hypothetical protein